MDLRIDSPSDLLTILKRRRRVFIAWITAGILGTLAVGFLWPPLYQSIATILIEEPDVPKELVSSTVTSYADQRIQVISQRVMSTPNLIAVIEKYDLYAKRRNREPIGVIVKGMREDIELSLISAEVVDPRSRKTSTATIAFNLAFNHRNPARAQRILNELVSLHLAENLRVRREKASDTTEFLAGEARKYEVLVDELETNLAAFKSEHSGNLPEQMPVKTQLKERTERELLDIRRQRQALDERQIYLEAELAQISPSGGMAAQGDEWDPVERLRTLQSQLISLNSAYGAEHPDVRRIEREIEALKSEVGPGENRKILEQERETILGELSVARQKYSDQHPDVLQLRRKLAGVQESLQALPADGDPAPSGVAPTNPAYIQIQAQLSAVRADRRALRQQHDILVRKRDAYDTAILKAPEIEREYRLLVRDYETALGNYHSVKTKLTQAELGESLEAESKAEQFSLIEPPTTPIAPIFPNYLALLALGIVASLGMSGGSALLSEVMDETIHGPRQIATVTGSPPLMVVPRIQNSTDKRRRKTILVLWIAGTLLFVLVGLWMVDTFVSPIDVIWSVMQRRIELVVYTIGAY